MNDDILRQVHRLILDQMVKDMDKQMRMLKYYYVEGASNVAFEAKHLIEYRLN